MALIAKFEINYNSDDDIYVDADGGTFDIDPELKDIFDGYSEVEIYDGLGEGVKEAHYKGLWPESNNFIVYDVEGKDLVLCQLGVTKQFGKIPPIIYYKIR